MKLMICIYVWFYAENDNKPCKSTHGCATRATEKASGGHGRVRQARDFLLSKIGINQTNEKYFHICDTDVRKAAFLG